MALLHYLAIAALVPGLIALSLGYVKEIFVRLEGVVLAYTRLRAAWRLLRRSA